MDIELPGAVTRFTIPDDGQVEPQALSDDGYPNVIASQTTEYGIPLTTTKDVVVFWDQFLSRQRPPRVRSQGEGSVTPYINQSRWIANCPNCNDGMLCWDRNPQTCCLGCGHTYEVNWQAPQERSEAIRLIASRTPQHRNWDAHKGETSTELAIQNILTEGIKPEMKDGLLVAGDVTIPNEFTSVNDYLDSLNTERKKN